VTLERGEGIEVCSDSTGAGGVEGVMEMDPAVATRCGGGNQFAVVRPTLHRRYVHTQEFGDLGGGEEEATVETFHDRFRREGPDGIQKPFVPGISNGKILCVKQVYRDGSELTLYTVICSPGWRVRVPGERMERLKGLCGWVQPWEPQGRVRGRH
jgi:hypothetical protein